MQNYLKFAFFSSTKVWDPDDVSHDMLVAMLATGLGLGHNETNALPQVSFRPGFIGPLELAFSHFGAGMMWQPGHN